MFALDRDKFRVKAPVGHHFGEVLHDMGLRGNGIGADHIAIGMSDGLGYGQRYFDSFTFLSHLFFLAHHGDAAHRAFPGADAASLAVIQIGLEMSFFGLDDGRIRTI